MNDTTDVAGHVRVNFDRQGLMAHLGAQLVHARDGVARIELGYGPQLSQQHGYFHAGATSAIADSAGGYAALSVFEPDASVLTVDFTMNLIAPARGERLEAVGTVVRAGRTLTVCRLEVTAVADGTRTVVAIGQQTVIRITARNGA